MTRKTTELTTKTTEKALLVGVSILGEESLLTLTDSLGELELLAETAGLEVVGEITQKITTPNPKTFVGSGKVIEVKTLAFG